MKNLVYVANKFERPFFVSGVLASAETYVLIFANEFAIPMLFRCFNFS